MPAATRELLRAENENVFAAIDPDLEVAAMAFGIGGPTGLMLALGNIRRHLNASVR